LISDFFLIVERAKSVDTSAQLLSVDNISSQRGTSNLGRESPIEGFLPRGAPGGNLHNVHDLSGIAAASVLCHGLCHNHRVPAYVERCRALSLRYT
jgi:hypothetical protein